MEKKKAVCAACQKQIDFRSEFFMGKVSTRRFPVYKVFHKRCYEEIYLSKKSELRDMIKASTSPLINSIINVLSFRKSTDLSRSTIASHRFRYALGERQLNSYRHFVMEILFYSIFLLLIHLWLRSYSDNGFNMDGSEWFIIIPIIAIAITLLVELGQLAYYGTRFSFDE